MNIFKLDLKHDAFNFLQFFLTLSLVFHERSLSAVKLVLLFSGTASICTCLYSVRIYIALPELCILADCDNSMVRDQGTSHQLGQIALHSFLSPYNWIDLFLHKTNILVQIFSIINI